MSVLSVLDRVEVSQWYMSLYFKSGLNATNVIGGSITPALSWNLKVTNFLAIFLTWFSVTKIDQIMSTCRNRADEVWKN